MYHNISIPFQGHREWPLNITNSRNNCLKVCTNTKEKTMNTNWDGYGWLGLRHLKIKKKKFRVQSQGRQTLTLFL